MGTGSNHHSKIAHRNSTTHLALGYFRSTINTPTPEGPSMLQDLVTNPLFQFANFALAVIGVILAYYFYRKTRNKKGLRYAFNNRALVRGPATLGDAIALSYNGTPIGMHRMRRVAISVTLTCWICIDRV